MRHLLLTIVAGVALLTTALAAPSDAEASFRIGGDLRWVPVAEEGMSDEAHRYQPDRQLNSVGISGRALLGFEYFALGARTGVTRHSFGDPDLNFTQLDINAHLRSGMPFTRLRFYGEVGPSVALDVGEVGFNLGAGIEVDVLGWPLIDLNLGLGAQYSKVWIGSDPGESRLNDGLRGMVTIGADISLF